MMPTHQCKHCNHINRSEAKYCQKCGALMNEKVVPRAAKSSADSKKSGFFTRVLSFGKQVGKVGAQMMEGLDETLADAVKNVTGTPAEGGQSDISDVATTKRVSYPVPPKRPGEQISFYPVLEVRELKHSNYYTVRSLTCDCGKVNASGEICAQCQKPLDVYLLRESAPGSKLKERHRQRVIELSQKIPRAVQHVKIFDQGQKQYIVLSSLQQPWFSLAERLPVVEIENVIRWITQIGNALKLIHASGYTFYDENRLTDWVEPILILDNQQAYFADLTSCTPISPNTPNPAQKDIFYLTKVLYTLVTGDRQNVLRLSGQLSEAPVSINNLINQVRSGKYTTMDEFLLDLKELPKTPVLTRSLRQLVGYGTDVGRQRDHNEDFVSKFSLGLEQIPGTPEVGLYIVADGMGGHHAGEKASETVIKDVVINRIQEQMNKLQSVPKLKRATIRLDEMLTPGEILQDAIDQANQVLLKARSQVASDRGTTITAALVVGDTCVAANVGDSRTYLMHNGKLEQITTDHSLVASLVAAGMIKPEEVRSHPQRNQIYRTLGDKPGIEVDIFQRSLMPGDKLLLCSDGLWEMVLDETIANILQKASSPQAACDRLIEAANAAGGEDNISVIVVWLE